MAGISRAERGRRAQAKIDAMRQPIKVTINSDVGEVPVGGGVTIGPNVSIKPVPPVTFGSLDPPVTGNRPQDGVRMLEAWTPSALARLHALCAALPYSGTANAQGVIAFADRLEAAKVNARAILVAAGEP